MGKKPSYQIPFDEQGDLVTYPNRCAEWRDNYEFEDTLEYEGYSRGRSSVTIIFTGSTGVKYEMFVSDFDEVIRTKGLDGKIVTAKWTFVKKGQNYGLKLVSA